MVYRMITVEILLGGILIYFRINNRCIISVELRDGYFVILFIFRYYRDDVIYYSRY